MKFSFENKKINVDQKRLSELLIEIENKQKIETAFRNSVGKIDPDKFIENTKKINVLKEDLRKLNIEKNILESKLNAGKTKAEPKKPDQDEETEPLEPTSAIAPAGNITDIEPEEETKSKKESKKKKESPEPKEQVEEFLKEYKLGNNLPQGFEDLSDAQQLYVVQNLKKRIVDIVKSDAETQYSKYLKDKMTGSGESGKMFDKIMQGLKNAGKGIQESGKKEFELKELENKAFKKLQEEEESQKLIAEDFKLLTKSTKDKRVIYDKEDNELYVSYIDRFDLENSTEEENDDMYEFNKVANEFREMPYEWGQESKNLLGGNRRKYEKAKKQYEEARKKILDIKAKREKPEERGMAMVEVAEIDSAVQMEQLLNTHPEFEKELSALVDKAGNREKIKTASNFINTITGKNWTNRGLMVAGFLAKKGVKSATAASSLNLATLAGTAIVGGAIGSIRGGLKGMKIVEEKQKGTRYGKEDKSAEIRKASEAKNLTERMEAMIKAVEIASTWEEREAHLDQLRRRINYTQGKIEQGLVNFGDAKSAYNNQFHLIDGLNRAAVTSASFEDTVRIDVDKRLGTLLSKKQASVDEAERKFIKKQMWQGAKIGAGFATLGYTVRWFGEATGWWGEHPTEILNHTPKEVVQPHVEPLVPKTDTVIPPPLPDTLHHQADAGLLQKKIDVVRSPATPKIDPVAQTHENIDTQDHHTVIVKSEVRQESTLHPDKSEVDQEGARFHPYNTPVRPPENPDMNEKSGTFRHYDKPHRFGHKKIIVVNEHSTEDKLPSGTEHVDQSHIEHTGEDHSTEPTQEQGNPSGNEYEQQEIGDANNISAGDTDQMTGEEINFEGSEHTDIPTDNFPKVTIADHVDNKIPGGSGEHIHADSINDHATRVSEHAKIPEHREVGNNYHKVEAKDLQRGPSQHLNEIKGGKENISGNQSGESLNDGTITDSMSSPHLSQKMLVKVNEVYKNNINHVFPDGRDTWENVKGNPAESLWNIGESSKEYANLGDSDTNLFNYLRKLHSVTKLEPRAESLVTKAETTGEYIKRALEEAAKKGLLDQVKV